MYTSLNDLVDGEFTVNNIGKLTITVNKIGKLTIRTLDTELEKLIREKLSKEAKKDYFVLEKEERKLVLFEAFERSFDENEQETYLEDGGFDYGNIEILVNMQKEAYLIYDTEKKDIIDVDYESVKGIMNPKDFGGLQMHPCICKYDPDATNETIEWINDGHNNYAHVNLYRDPSWRKENSFDSLDLTGQDFRLPDSARIFFKHLFPNKKSRNYVFAFLYDAMVSRNGSEFILLLNSPTGTGKTILSRDVFKALVGNGNFKQAQKSLFNKEYNKVLVNARGIYVDEARVTRDTYSTVKLYANNWLNIEAKNVEADNDTELFFSMIVTNNIIGQYYVHHDDRRNSVVEVTNKKLLNLWSGEQVAKFKEDLKDDDFIGAIGNYILSRTWDENREELFRIEQFRGPKFFSFIHRHLSSWEKKVLKVVKKAGNDMDEEITLSSLLVKLENTTSSRAITPHEDTLIEFFQYYSHEGKGPLGVVIEDKESEQMILKIDDRFIKTELDELL